MDKETTPHPSGQLEQKGSCGHRGELCLGTEQARTHRDTHEGTKLQRPKGRARLGIPPWPRLCLVMQVKELSCSSCFIIFLILPSVSPITT